MEVKVNKNGERVCSRIELLLLILTAFCLPLFEAPKNIASILFIIVWIVSSFKTNNFGKAAPFEWPIGGLAIVLWISPFFSDFTSPAEAGRWTLLAIFVSLSARLKYTRQQVFIIISAFLSGYISAVVESFLIWHQSQNIYPEFRSVGHVNHSVMYSNVAFGVGLSCLFSTSRFTQTLGFTSIIPALIYWLPSNSTGGAITMLAIGIIAAVFWAKNEYSTRIFVVTICLILISFFGLMLSPIIEPLKVEILYRIEMGEYFAGRDKILFSALAVWDRHPIFGTGWGSFGQATAENSVRAALLAHGTSYDPTQYYHTSHGHNVFTTILVERGIMGLFFLTLLLYQYVKFFTKKITLIDNLKSQSSYMGMIGLLTTVGFIVGGLTNTTMMNEHGQAGMLMIALAYSSLNTNTDH